MKTIRILAIGSALSLLAAAGVATAEPPPERGGGAPQRGGGAHAPAPARGEPHEGPHGYQRVNEPAGWNARPATVDRDAYHHNYQAARSFKIGPYHRPRGWAPHHWGYGEILPRAYWGPSFLIADYWLFALEVPPAGYEWVRDDSDALLVDTSSGEILQVEYGVFA
jgi:Ni/Co efflux regulator RcnB